MPVSLLADVLPPLAELTALERWQARNWPGGSGTTHGWQLAVLLAMLGLLVLSLFIIVLNRLIGQARHHRAFLTACRKAGINAQEQDLLRLLARLGECPRPDVILIQEMFFEGGITRLIASPKVQKMSDSGRICIAQMLQSIRQKLGFVHSLEAQNDNITHTRQIPEAVALSMAPSGSSEPVNGTMARNSPFEMDVELEEPRIARAGDSWMVRYCDGGSVWEFDTTVIRQLDNRIYLNHTDSIRFINRRSFPRLSIRRPAKIAPFPFDLDVAHPTTPEYHEAYLVELAGVGLKIESPVAITRGQRALVILNLSGTRTIQSLVKVHRCSVLGPGKSLLSTEMIGLNSASVSEMARETNLVAIGSQKAQAAAAPAPPMRTSQAAQEVAHA